MYSYYCLVIMNLADPVGKLVTLPLNPPELYYTNETY